MTKNLSNELYKYPRLAIMKFIESGQQNKMPEIIHCMRIPVEHIFMPIKIVYAVKMNDI
jgi:hypothetical protein